LNALLERLASKIAGRFLLPRGFHYKLFAVLEGEGVVLVAQASA